MNQSYVKYGLIAAAVIVVLYALMKGRSSQAQATSGTVAVDVQYSGSIDQSGSVGARSQAFSELVGLSGLVVSEESDLEQSRMSNALAGEIARGEERTTRYGLDIGRQIEEMRIRGSREMAEAQAASVNAAAESFRNKGADRMSSYLNALTSIWGAQPVYAPQRESALANIIGSIANAASNVFNPVGGR